MAEDILGIKELYDVVLKVNQDCVINNQHICAGQVVGRFNKIQIAHINETKTQVQATGGYGNRALVIWDDTDYVSLTFTQGVFSINQWAILLNSQLVTGHPKAGTLIPCYEETETDENGKVQLHYPPEQDKFFITKVSTGELIKDYELDFDTITLNEPYMSVIVDYYTLYNRQVSTITVGMPFTQGFLTLEGRTRLKDDKTGALTTGILTIPKLKLRAGLSMQLGQAASPAVGTFHAEGYPVRDGSTKKVCELIILSDDIDCDF